MTFSVIYRKGGLSNFTWNRVLETYSSSQEAVLKAAELQRAGYPALVHKTNLLDSIGLPETYE